MNNGLFVPSIERTAPFKLFGNFELWTLDLEHYLALR